MGMLLSMALILAVISAWLEFKVLNTIPFFRKLNKKSQLVGLAFSIGLSWAVGALFGATGLVVLIAGLLSTAMTEPVHGLNRYREKNNNQITTFMTDLVATWRPVFKLIKIMVIIALMPIWLPVIIRRKYMQMFGPKVQLAA